MKKILFLLAFTAGIVNAQEINLQNALRLAESNSPAIKQLFLQASAIDATGRQALKWDSPEFSLEAENWGGNKGGLDDAEYTAILSQTLSLNDKKMLVNESVLAQSDAMRISANTSKIQLQKTVKQLFAELLAIQYKCEAIERHKELVEKLLEEIKGRIKAGAGSNIETLQAENEMIKVEFDLVTAKQTQQNLAQLLSSYVGKPVLFATGNLFDWAINPVPEKNSGIHSEILLLRAEEASLESAQKVEKANAVPDLTVYAGYRYEGLDNVNSFLVGFVVPLPFWDKKKDAINAVMLECEAKQYEIEQKNVELERTWKVAYSTYQLSKNELEICQNVLQPKIEEMEKAMYKGYQHGLYNLMNVIAVQHEQAELEVRTINAALQTITAICEIEYLKGEEN